MLNFQLWKLILLGSFGRCRPDFLLIIIIIINYINSKIIFRIDGLKLCDFGISRVINKSCEVREIVGTPDYVAPEVLQYDPVSLRTDIWSVGVLAYVLLSGCSPFAGDTKQETFLNISKCNLTFPEDLFETVSTTAIDFITDTLQIKPQ